MNDSPRISAIIPTYSRPERLAAAVASALGAATSIEVLLVNDASPDPRVAEACDELAAQNPNVRVLHLLENRGVAGARNAALDVARGEFVAFHDDDDRRLPGSYDLQADVLDAQPNAAFCHGQAELADEKGAPTGVINPRDPLSGDCFRQLAAWNGVQNIAALSRLARVREVGNLDESVSRADDWDLWLRLSARYSVAALREVVAVYREPRAGSGQGSSRLIAHLQLARRVQERALHSERGQREGAAWQAEARQGFARGACDWLLSYGWNALNDGHNSEARRALRQALRFNPRRLASRRVPLIVARLMLPAWGKAST